MYWQMTRHVLYFFNRFECLVQHLIPLKRIIMHSNSSELSFYLWFFKLPLYYNEELIDKIQQTYQVSLVPSALTAKNVCSPKNQEFIS